MALTVLAVVAVDQATKTYAERHFALHPVVVGPIRFVEVRNSGVAFSLGVGHPLLVGVVATLVGAAVALWGLRRPSRLSRAAASLVVAGAVSNLLDRVVRHNRGAVIDWIQLPYWPVFNLADAAVTVGIVLLVVAELRGSRAHAPR